MDNPELAINSILESEQTIGDLVVKPLTIARIALLEAIDSPFMNPAKKFDAWNMITSAFVVTADIELLRGFNTDNIQLLIDKSLDWGDKVDINALPKVIESVLEKLNKLYKINPATGTATESSTDSKKKE